MNEFSVLDQLETHLQTKKVGIEEFAESAKFCDEKLYPKQRLLLKLIFLEELTDLEEHWLDEWIASKEVTIAPDIRERVQWCRDHKYPHFREIVFVGGRRSSKGFITAMVMAKKMYDTLQLQDPNAHYGIQQDKAIYFTAVAASEKQAKELQYADMANTVKSCRAMDPYIAKLQELEFSVHTDATHRELANYKSRGQRVQKDITRLRGRALASNSRTIRGYTSMGIVFDEMAFFMQGESDQSDSEVYEAALPSLDQFQQDAILFCNSSPYTKVGKFYERFQESQKTEAGAALSPEVLGLQFPSWALFEDWWKDPQYRGKPKCITVSPDWDVDRKKEDGTPYYSIEDRATIGVARAAERRNPEKFKVERRAIWAEVVDAYLSPERVDQMFAGRPVADGEGFEPFKTNWNDSTYMHRYKAHLDPSSTTAGFGFALGHTEHIEVDGRTQEHVVFDIIKRWRPGDFPNHVINWEPIITEILHYADIFRPYEITFDQFQSAAPMQELNRELRKRGIGETKVYEKTATAQVNWNRAETFKTALYQGMIHAPNDLEVYQGDLYPALELKYLQQQNTGRSPRVDKQDVGPVTTKDMADCMMEVTEALIGNLIARQMREDLSEPPSFGGQGGYPLGGPDRGGNSERRSPFADLYTRRMGEQRGMGSGFSGSRSASRPGIARGGRPNPARGGRW
jgi:hypothetical protein